MITVGLVLKFNDEVIAKGDLLNLYQKIDDKLKEYNVTYEEIENEIESNPFNLNIYYNGPRFNFSIEEE